MGVLVAIIANIDPIFTVFIFVVAGLLGLVSQGDIVRRSPELSWAGIIDEYDVTALAERP